MDTGQQWLLSSWWVWAGRPLQDHDWWVSAWRLVVSSSRWIHSTGIIFRHLLRQRVSKLWLQMLHGCKVLWKRPRIAVSVRCHHTPLVEWLWPNTGRKLCPARILVSWMRLAGSLVERCCGILRRKVVAWCSKALHTRNTPGWLWWNTWHRQLVPQTQ